MKQIEIKEGRVYHDGKQGVREVVNLKWKPGELRYKVLAARMQVDLGGSSYCAVPTFATWAKADVTDKKDVLLNQLAASRIKLSATETALMVSLAAEFSDKGGVDLKAGCEVSFKQSERRAAKGLESKGFLKVNPGEGAPFGGHLVLKDLAVGWVQFALEAGDVVPRRG